MNAVGIFKSIFPYTLKLKIKNHLGVPSLNWSLINLKKIGYVPRNVLDIGAYEGHWSRDFLCVFPNTNILMLEAQESKRLILEKFANQYENVHVAIALLSDEDGKIMNFIENETASHISHVNSSNPNFKYSRKVDSVLSDLASGSPDFIKIDVQGHELEVLRGAEKVLKDCIFCLLEVSLLSLGNEPPLIEVMNYMDENGFQLYDISQFMRRPYDKALYQSDFLFIKKNSTFISHKRWD
jgi:FkbM family methyltransferase